MSFHVRGQGAIAIKLIGFWLDSTLFKNISHPGQGVRILFQGPVPLLPDKRVHAVLSYTWQYLSYSYIRHI
jgi:hypothetical protein